jgi:hypothetical protein
MSEFNQSAVARRAKANWVEATIACPSCSTEIKLTESLAAPLIHATRQEYDAKFADKEREVSARENAIRDQQRLVEQARKSIDEQVAARLISERAAISREEAKKAKLASASDLDAKAKEVADLHEVLAQRNAKLEEAQKAQADLIRKQRELDDAKREVDLTVEKRVQSSLAEIRQMAKQEADDGLRLKVIEREEQIASMQRQIEQLKRKSEQGSQQLQGEALELELETALRTKFPTDRIEPVGKGEFGGDILHGVNNPAGVGCGSILWETKRTKNWSDAWLAKLRADQRAAKAEVAILITSTLPKDIVNFGQIEGVWVAGPRMAASLAMALRIGLIEIANTRQVQQGQETKMELVYQYLTGPKFRHRVEAIVEKISEMQIDLARERKATTRLWAKRETQIQGVIDATVGMYGDLQGIAGKAIQEIDGLELPLLEACSDGN